MAARSRSTPKPHRRSVWSAVTTCHTQSLIAGVPVMYAGDSPRMKPMFWIDSAVLT